MSKSSVIKIINSATWKGYFLGVALFLISPISIAYVTIQVVVRVLGTPCTINGGNSIEVDFGPMLSSEINGNNYQKKIVYNVSCPLGESPNRYMTMLISGSSAAGDASIGSNVLATTSPDLGIKILAKNLGGNPLELNKATSIYYEQWPEITAVPVKLFSNNALTPGSFYAAATLTITYQ